MIQALILTPSSITPQEIVSAFTRAAGTKHPTGLASLPNRKKKKKKAK